MAAPPGNPSPSNKTVDPQEQHRSNATAAASAAAVGVAGNDDNDNDIAGSEDANGSATKDAPVLKLKDPPAYAVAPAAAAATGMKDTPPVDAGASAAAPPLPTAGNVPTYESSEQSENYNLAKEFLNAGEFEEAMIRLEEEIETTKTVLSSLLSSSAAAAETAAADPDIIIMAPPNNIPAEQFCELHTSLAPLHYLYGTTLLYSLEEAKDDTAQFGGGGGGRDGDDADDAGGSGGHNEAVSMTVAGSMAEQAIAAAQAAQDNATSMQAAPAQGESEPSPDGDDNVDDMMIAWENLEAARTILERMLTCDDSISNKDDMDKYRLDLAQTLLRVADLQRLNGRYQAAIQDYTSCLELRQEVFADDPWNRKIADAQYNLGLTYLTSSSELMKENATATTEDTSTKTVTDPTALSKEHCRKGIEMYLNCARTFSGILALSCGADPSEVVAASSGEEMEAVATSAPQPTGGLKTTGLYDDDERHGGGGVDNVASDASLQLSVWRSRIAKLMQTQAPADEGAAAEAYDLQQLLDEVQETIDEAERSHEGVKQASQIKARAQAAVAAASASGDGVWPAAGGGNTDADGVTTSIGFGSAASVMTSSTAPATGQPVMMVVKKKKRTKEESQDGKEGAASSSEDAKRIKTSE